MRLYVPGLLFGAGCAAVGITGLRFIFVMILALVCAKLAIYNAIEERQG